jgi:hypothetical protein
VSRSFPPRKVIPPMANTERKVVVRRRKGRELAAV